MALIELAATPFECSQVVICLDRGTEPEESRALMKSLRWVGFELVTLEMWARHRTAASDKWLFLGMEL
jgi:Ornithine decarboxylase antizyme